MSDLKYFLLEHETRSPHFLLQISFLSFIPHSIYFFIEKRRYFEIYRREFMLLYPTSLRALASNFNPTKTNLTWNSYLMK